MRVPATRVVFRAEDGAEIAAAIAGILASGCVTLGPCTERFETAFAAACLDWRRANGSAPAPESAL